LVPGGLYCAGIALRDFGSEKELEATVNAYRRLREENPRNVAFGDKGLVFYSIASLEELTKEQRWYFSLVKASLDSIPD